MKTKIELGDKVRCKYSGFMGIAVAETKFINGCVQFSVLPKGTKNNKMPDELSLDSQSLEVISRKKKPVEKKENGGPIQKGIKQRGF